MTNKFKVGDYVRIDNEGGYYHQEICQIVRESVGGSWYDARILHSRIVDDFYEDALEPYTRTIEDVEAGDTLVDDQGKRRLVLGRSGDIVFLSRDNTKTATATWDVISKLLAAGFKLAGEEEIEELTEEEVSRRLGKKIIFKTKY